MFYHTVLLHDSQELNEWLGNGAEEYLSLASSLGIDDGSHGVCEDIDSHQILSLKLY